MEIAVTSGADATISADLYSEEGMRLITDLWLKASFYHRVMYEPTWLGIPIIQLPNDIVFLQELIWKIRPDVIIETGVAHGGSAIFYASILDLLGKGRVIGIDIEIRKYNRLAIESHPQSRRIELIEGSSIDPGIVDDLRKRVSRSSSVLVSLDSNHSYEHVLREMEIYSEFVPPGGYMVVMDGVQELLCDTPNAKEGWDRDNPLAAIREFLSSHRDWRYDPYYTRTHITCNPCGFLRKNEEI
jgi:cephalosporin hydroxylase